MKGDNVNTKKEAWRLKIIIEHVIRRWYLMSCWSFQGYLYIKLDYFLLDIMWQIKWLYPKVQWGKQKSILRYP